MQKNILVSIAILSLIFICASTASAQEARNGKDIFGYFYLAGSIPKDFRNISEVNLAGDYGAKQKPPFYGLIRLKRREAADFKLLRPTGTGKSISFTTKTVGGFSYRFAGKFTRLDIEEKEVSINKVVLTGKLTKLRGGKEVAQSNVRFTYLPGT